MPEPVQLLNASAIQRTLNRLAHEIVERNPQNSDVVIVGIQRGGVQIAKRLGPLLNQIWKAAVPIGELDVSMHRDDLDRKAAPEVHPTHIPFDITNKTVILVDDVLFHGRTVRAAMDALTDLGRPAAIQLAVLIDRGHRQLPIKPDFVGKNVPTSLHQRISVDLAPEPAGTDSVHLDPE